VKPLSTEAARRVRGIGRRIIEARRRGDRDKEQRYRKSAKAMIAEFGPDVRREIGVGQREQLRRPKKRG
jgi:hypothetical protein